MSELNNKLAYMQQVALEGEIAFAVCTSAHNAEIKYRVYLILKDLQEDYRDYIIQAVKDITTFPEGELERVLWEVSQDDVPLWIWIDKCIADLKLATSQVELTNTPESRMSVRKKEAKLNLVKSAFNKFIREVSICCSQAARELLTRIQEDKDLEFLHPSCTFCLQELHSLEAVRPPKSKIPATVMEMTFDAKNMLNILSFAMETAELERLNKSSKDMECKAQNLLQKAKESDKEGFIEALDEVISSVVGETIEGLAKKESEKKLTSKGTRYIVMKKFTQSNFQIPLRDFNTQSEALLFVNELIENFPELKKVCTFNIIQKEEK